jgi:hypothetical protein
LLIDNYYSAARVAVTGGAASTNTTTGAITVTGGVGVTGSLNVGGDLILCGERYSGRGWLYMGLGPYFLSSNDYCHFFIIYYVLFVLSTAC